MGDFVPRREQSTRWNPVGKLKAISSGVIFFKMEGKRFQKA
jgi:hypothetical protein